MISIRPLVLLGILSLGFISFSALAVDRGQLMADTCLACHSGINSEAAIPNLAAYPSSMIISQMQAFRDGSRPSTLMIRHAKGYSDEEVAMIAKYLGVQGQ